jgi:type I restriction enzyme M protein
MSPKGGIKPNQKFSLKSGKSEVLFVEYIMNHLKPHGRSAIVVPEGIVIQIGKAYKELRKSLLKDGLYAVLSLHSGVFKPYSGVKTDILFIDKSLSDSEEILFIEISNDGFDVGASKSIIEENDLPEALEILNMWKTGQKSSSKLALYVPKENIAAKGDYKLLGKRYRESRQSGSKWEIRKLGELADIKKGQAITQKKTKPGLVPVIAGGQSPAYFHDEANRIGRTITVSASGAYAGFVNYFEVPIFASDCSTIQSKDEKLVRTDYLYRVLKEIQDQIYELQSGGGQPHVYPSDLIELEIPIPPLEIQDEILGQIGTLDNTISEHESEIQSAKQAIESLIIGLWDE